VWNRQYTDHQEAQPGDKRTSVGAVRRWNPKDQWAGVSLPTVDRWVDRYERLGLAGLE
jgi:hypothetical protein